MIAKVTIEKTFDDGSAFKKSWENGDFKDFFNDEGVYLDRLSEMLKEKGAEGDYFEVTYTVTVTK